jgi:hypothetical protein
MPDFARKPKAVLYRKILVINFRPAAIPTQWNNADGLIENYIQTMRQASNNLLIYHVVNKMDVTSYPMLLDGRQYDDASWTQALNNDATALRDAHGNYMMADYQRILQDFNLLQQIKNKTIDEVWMFGGPYFGFFESRMVGKGAFWCNAPGIEATSPRFILMGFNYQREVKEMVHDFGHRAESILAWKFASQSFLQQLYAPSGATISSMPAPANEFEAWLLVNGTVHRKPGGEDYGQDELTWVTALKPEWFPFVIDPNKVK